MTENATAGKDARPPEVQATEREEAGDQSAEKSKKPKKEFEIDIFRDWCKCCGICAAFCPRKCIGLDEEGSPVLEQSEQCTGCGWCEAHCPDFAISVRERKKKSVLAEDEEQD